MISLVEQITNMGAGTVIMCFIIVLSFIVSAISLKDKVLDALDLKTGGSIRYSEINERLEAMDIRINTLDKRISDTYDQMYEKQKGYHQQSIQIRNDIVDTQKHLDERFKNFMTRFDGFVESENEKTVAGFRSSLWRMHKDFVEQGFVTPDGLKTFLEMGKTYEKAGGDDIYHDKLLPEVRALEIRYPDGSIYNK